MHWQLTWASDPAALALADRHYNRQSVGSKHFMPPARKVVFLSPGEDALWGTSWPYPSLVKHGFITTDTWNCTIFRNEGPLLSSELIRDAVAATRFVFGEPPVGGMITFVNPDKIHPKRDPGRCFLRAGFVKEGVTPKGLVVLRLSVDAMPPAEEAPIRAEAVGRFRPRTEKKEELYA